jgi:predicted RNA-binding protein YlqC (UPF0109 family)
MKDLVVYIAKSIVNDPDAVNVEEETNEEGITLKLRVADDDKGRIIGKQGQIAQAMRAPCLESKPPRHKPESDSK